MNVLELARQLGHAIQQDERYIAYTLAKQANDEDEALQNLIQAFELKRMELQMALGKEEKDQEAIAQLNDVVKEIYQRIMQSPKMMVYNAAKQGYDQLQNEVNTIISMSLSGADPDQIDPETAGCTGSCSTCGGCG
ncbi:MAG: YlbF family regulator [Oscillospiraceae bacterium]|nr:YlbF family regulator [Oscillospiraceae bacterium]